MSMYLQTYTHPSVIITYVGYMYAVTITLLDGHLSILTKEMLNFTALASAGDRSTFPWTSSLRGYLLQRCYINIVGTLARHVEGAHPLTHAGP